MTGAEPAGERGLALILVLWVLALLALILASFLAVTRGETDLAQARIAAAEATALADGGVHWAIGRLAARAFSDDPTLAAFPVDGTALELTLAGGSVVVRVYDVSGLVDINAAEPELLRGLMIASGIDPAGANRLAARIADYRDTDDRPQPGGAELDQYLSAGRQFGPRNAPFARSDELRQVLDMPGTLVSALDPYVTVDSGSRGIDPDKAPLRVLAAVPGLAEPDIALILASRRRGEELAGLERLRSPYLIPASSGAFRIVADGRSASGGRFLRDATIQLRGAGTLFSVRHWGQALADQSPE